MDAAAQLALLVKAKAVFEAPDTFLSVPVAPLPFTKRQLDFYAQDTAADLAASLANLQAFSRLVNMIPSGPAWAPSGTTLWDVYRTILQGQFADSTRTADEEADYQQAVGFLRRTRDDGTWEDSVAVKEYRQYKDAWLFAQQRFAALRAGADASTDPQERDRWRTVDEPRERAALAAIEQAWIVGGHKSEVETAQAQLARLNGRSPIQAWSEWNARFNADIDAMHGAMFQGEVFPSPFAPTNAIEEGAWLPFTLTESEITRLVAEAPVELREKVDGDGPSKLKSLSFEFSSATIVRPWFSPEVFRARFWRLSDGAPAICDGATPPSGMCPAYVTAVVFARHVREEHKSGTPAPDRQFEGFTFVAGRAALKDARTAVVVRDHRTPPPAGPLAMGRRAFTAVGAGVVAPAVASPPVAPPPAVPVGPASGVRLRALRNMAFTRLAVPATASPTATTQPEEIYVLAFICKRVGRCPDPDPALTW